MQGATGHLNGCLVPLQCVLSKLKGTSLSVGYLCWVNSLDLKSLGTFKVVFQD